MCDNSHQQSGQFRLDRCGCGTYHLTMRDTTLRLSAVELQIVAHVLFGAMNQYAEEIEDDTAREYRQQQMRDRFGRNWQHEN